MGLTRRGAVVAVGTSLALAVAGCGGEDGTAAKPPAAAKARTAAKVAAGGGPVAIAIEDFEYAPTRVKVARGTKVTWTNKDAANHTVTFDTGSRKGLGNQAKGRSRSFTFKRAGTFAYHCEYHPNMHGTVVVR